MDIAYLSSSRELPSLPAGQDAYLDGIFFHVRSIRHINNNATQSPCTSLKCVFNHLRLAAGRPVCPYFQYCASSRREDKKNVVFIPFKPTTKEYNDFLLWCKFNGKIFYTK